MRESTATKTHPNPDVVIVTEARRARSGEPAGPADPQPPPPGSTTDENVLAELRREHGHVLLGFLLRLTNGDRDRAEDLLQETLIRAWRHPQILHSQHESVRPWLITVSRRLAIDAHRAALARPVAVRYEDMDGAEPSKDPTERSTATMDVRNALRSLDPAHRQILLEVYFHGLSIAETAEKLGIPEGTVKSRTYYALRQLRSRLHGYGRLT
jgi:RNA polymerase sigma-70 factor (ECF subfamily)